jgi:parallel beta-helix repeat protein
MVGNQGQGQRVSREFVIETFNRSTQEKTRLATAERDVSDAQYFRLFAVDGSNVRPTAGFVSVSSEAELDRALTLGWGTVIEVTQSITLSRGRKTVPQGVTIRGYRKFTDNGPEIHYPVAALTRCDDENLVRHCAFVLQNNSRFTSLRLRGPRTTPAGSSAEGIFFRDDGQFTNVTVDRIDASDWNNSAIHVSGAFTDYGLECCSYSDPACVDHDPTTPAPPRFRYPRLTPVKLLGNIIHNNNGYGIVIGGGANPLVRGNLFFHNVHSLTADGHGANGYVARDNLVTRWVIPGRPWTSNQFFDVHGTGDPHHWMGGRSGDIFDVAWNTFLSHDHRNFGQRGTPCRHTLYRNNVSVQGPAAVETHSDPPTTLIKSGNKFNASDPLNKLGVGDFDGDGLSDIFLATAATWWYSSGGRSEWRFLNRMPELIDTLRFGDFDGDRRTDIVSLDATGKIRISWAGASPWITTLPTGQTLDSIAVGNFDGDHRDDVFVANGFTWSFAAGGTEFKFIGQSRLRPRDLRFGDFNKDGKTDIFFVSGTNWQLVKGGGSGTPEHWRTALTPNVHGLVVADFDGDGHADIARDISGQWKYSARGLGGFINLRNAPSGQKLADRYVGHFDGDRKADVIVWDSVWFAIAPGPDNPVTRISWQGMR